jgi:hypothetical protein
MSRAVLGAWPEQNHDDWWLLMDELDQAAIDWIAAMSGVSAGGLRASPATSAKYVVPLGLVLRANGETKLKGEQ